MDSVQLPEAGWFGKVEDYYSTAFHELVHATGHESRLDRPEIGSSRFGSEPYSKEELTAEMGAAMLCGVAGISPATVDQSASYIANWLKALKDDRKLLVGAAGKAQKAADYIRDVKHETEAEPKAELAAA
jgi:antirestriction protein ArdC